MQTSSKLDNFKGIVLVVSAALTVTGLAYVLDKPFLANAVYMGLMYAIAALAWNILAGYTGLVSFGHAVFFGLGAYTAMLSMLNDLPAILGLLLACLVGLLSGILLAPVWLRLRSHWFTLATIATAEILKLSFIVWPAVGGSAGLQAPIAKPGLELYYLQFRGPYPYVAMASLLLLVEAYVVWRVVRGYIGYYWQALREDEEAAQALAINPFKWKLVALALSGLFTALSGALYTIRFRFIDPFTVFDLISVSTYIALAGIIGGIYSFTGPVIGALIVIPLAEYIRSTLMSIASRYAALHEVVLGFTLLLVSLLAPQGLTGAWLGSRIRILRVVWLGRRSSKSS